MKSSNDHRHTNVHVRLAALESSSIIPVRLSISRGSLDTQSLLYRIRGARSSDCSSTRPQESLRKDSHSERRRRQRLKRQERMGLTWSTNREGWYWSATQHLTLVALIFFLEVRDAQCSLADISRVAPHVSGGVRSFRFGISY
jgi:hypothetical protein